MVAWMFVFPPVGQEGKLQFKDLAQQMTENGVTSGIDSAAVLQLVQDQTYFQLVPIACGSLPVEGHDGRIVELYPREVQKEIKVDENGVADYRSQTYVQLIQEGTTICDIIPPEPGQAGLRVNGEVVEPKKVVAAKAPAGSNTKISEDRTKLVATRDGHLVFSNGLFMVRPLLEINGDVDYSTGNIDYRGDVHIHGDVRENFFVRATGTITIDGTVEAANVEAGGDLIVSCGVLGDNRATIKSGGNIRVKYLENCVAYAGKDVFADCIMSARVYSDGTISAATGRGTVIGGSLTAGYAVKARIIGSQGGMKTYITLGELPYNQERAHNDESDLRAVQQELKELRKTLSYLEEHHGLEGMDEQLAKAHLRKSVLSIKENKLLKDFDMDQSATPDLSKCHLQCEMIYPVTYVKIGDDNQRIDQILHRCSFGYDEETGTITGIE
jgi:uncharacterized protein (DUF342 family)